VARQRPAVGDDHGGDLLIRESRGVQGVSHQGEPIFHRGVVRLPEVSGHDRTLRPGGLDVLVAAQILLREFRVGGDDVMDAGAECRVRDGPDEAVNSYPPTGSPACCTGATPGVDS
jgi:hypothetical protein